MYTYVIHAWSWIVMHVYASWLHMHMHLLLKTSLILIKLFLLENLFHSYPMGYLSSIYPWHQGCAFPLELSPISLGDLTYGRASTPSQCPSVARHDSWRFTPSCKHPSVWLHIPPGLPILLASILRYGCPRWHPSFT
jgi:hypothetical protein